jgi:hypothetical protein
MKSTLLSLLAGFGTPWEATAAENKLRYLVLLINAVMVGAGLIVLKEALSVAGEHVRSTLGFAAITLAIAPSLVWGTAELYQLSAAVRADPSALPLMPLSMLAMADLLLSVGGVLTYLATAAFAASLGRARWIGRKTSAAFVIVSLLAAAFLAASGLLFPDPTDAFATWYEIPGFILGIPAIPWIMPVIFGVILLKRAGDQPGKSA